MPEFSQYCEVNLQEFFGGFVPHILQKFISQKLPLMILTKKILGMLQEFFQKLFQKLRESS